MNWRILLVGAMLIVLVGVFAAMHLPSHEMGQQQAGGPEGCTLPEACEDIIINHRISSTPTALPAIVNP
jgi:hypothetical protein